jgi:hypothetical protein
MNHLIIVICLTVSFTKGKKIALVSSCLFRKAEKEGLLSEELAKYQPDICLCHLNFFIRHIDDINSQEKANVVNTVLCLIAERYGLPWVNQNRRIENFNLGNAEVPSFLNHL